MTSATTRAMDGATPLSANLFCMASMMIWAAGLPAADHLIGILPPLPLAAARMVLAVAVLLPVWWLTESGCLRTTNWKAGFLVGAMLGVGALLLVIGQGMTDPVTVAIISAAMPVIGALIEVTFDGRRLTAGLMIGIALSLAGALVALDPGQGKLHFGLGAALMFFSVLLYAFGSRLTVTAFPDDSPLGRTTITLTGAALFTLAAALADGARGGELADWSAMDLKAWGALALFGIGGLALSQLFWIKALGRLGIALSSLHLNATPFYVMLILFALGAPWNWRQAAGAGLVGLGVLAAQNVFARKTRTDA